MELNFTVLPQLWGWVGIGACFVGMGWGRKVVKCTW